MVDYTEFVDLIHGYTNRSAAVLPYSLVKQHSNMAGDTILRELDIPPLEETFTYEAATEKTSLVPIPTDLDAFIQVREIDEITGDVIQIYNPRVDLRSFYNSNMSKYGDRYYTREKENLIIFPELDVGQIIQLHYYKRTPPLNARYSVVEENYTNGYLYSGASQSAVLEAVEASEPNASRNDPELEGAIELITGDLVIPDGWYLGAVYPNWLRDDNFKAILHGTLANSYFFLKNYDEARLNNDIMKVEISEMNKQARIREVTGGVAQTHFSGHGLL